MDLDLGNTETVLTPDQIQSALKIPVALEKMTFGKTDQEIIRTVYNEAINDAANFVRDLAPHNKNTSWTPAVLEAAGRSIRDWLTIPEGKT